MTKTKIAPSILSGDFANMADTTRKTEQWGADYVHFDVMDGVYVNNITFGMPMCKAIRPYTTLTLDVHLMIVEPEKYVERFCDSGADIVSFHPDASKDTRRTIELIKNKGKRVGLVLNPDKDLDLVLPYIDLIDMVLIMGVFPGFGGQKFIPEVLDKVRTLRKLYPEIDIELDGGVNEQNSQEIVSAGVNILVAGSAIFNAPDPKQALKNIKG